MWVSEPTGFPHPAALFGDELEIKLADVGCGGGRIPCTAPQSYGAPALVRQSYLASIPLDKPDKVR